MNATMRSCGGSKSTAPFPHSTPRHMLRSPRARKTVVRTTPNFIGTLKGTYSHASTFINPVLVSASSKNSARALSMCGYARVCTKLRASTAMLFTKSGLCSMRSSPAIIFPFPNRCGASASLAVISTVFSPTTCIGASSSFSSHSFRSNKMTFKTRVSRWSPASLKLACVPSTMHPSMVCSVITGSNTPGFAASPLTCLIFIPANGACMSYTFGAPGAGTTPIAAMIPPKSSVSTWLQKMIMEPGNRWLVISLILAPKQLG
mmetsp:Transcript_1873/g.6457  ORF Transcript_1873/g.6457 Transcript_1873/m.6457 type:complete len:261 (+) Transcript_1873:323-1105(+)